MVRTEWEDVEWECEERGGGGRGRRWPRRWGCRLGDGVSLPLLERQWSSLLLPTESRSSTTLREEPAKVSWYNAPPVGAEEEECKN